MDHILFRLFIYLTYYSILFSPFVNTYFYSKFAIDRKWKRSVVNIGIVIQVVRLIMFGLIHFTTTKMEEGPIGLLLFYWFVLTSLVSPVINIYWIVTLVRSVPRKIVIALITITIYLLFMYKTYLRDFGPL